MFWLLTCIKTLSLVLIILAVNLLTRSLPTFAQESLTLSKSLRLAKEQNLTIKAVQKEIEAFKGDIKQATLFPNPSLELEQTSRPFLGFKEGEKGLFLTQEFELGGKRPARLLVARKALEEAQWIAINTERLLLQQVKIQFHKAWTAQERLKILHQILEKQKQFLNVSDSRAKLGEIPGMEVRLFKVEYLRSKQKYEEAKKEMDSSLLELLQLIGLPADKQYNLLLPANLTREANLSLPLDLKELISRALQKRPDLKIQSIITEKAKAQIRMEETQAFPNVTLGAGLVQDKATVSGDDVTPGGIISSIQDKDKLFKLSISIPIPLFNRNQGNILKARHLYESALLKEQNLRTIIEKDVITSYKQVVANQKINEQFEKEILPTVKANFETIEKAYQLGGESILGVIQTQKTFMESQLGYLDNLLNLQESIALLESATGEE